MGVIDRNRALICSLSATHDNEHYRGFGNTLRSEPQQSVLSLFASGLRMLPRAVALDTIIMSPVLLLYALLTVTALFTMPDLIGSMQTGAFPAGAFFGLLCTSCGIVLLGIPLTIWEMVSMQALIVDGASIFDAIRQG